MFCHILRTYSRYKLLLRPDHAELVNHDGTKFTVVKRGRLHFLGICDGAVVLTMHVMSVIGMKFWVIAIMTIF